MEISVVIPTHNQEERLRLVLCGLAKQTLGSECFEVLVVDDGCTDGTRQMLEEVEASNLRSIALMAHQGRNQARNKGIESAEGELVVFLDGDALPGPELLSRYLEAYQRYGSRVVLCGFQYSLPDLEYFQDPQTGSLMELPLPSVMWDYIDTHLEEMVITEEMIQRDFAAVHARAREGGYPFEALKQLQDQVLELFAQCPGAAINWLGFSPHNGAIPHDLLFATGGFDEQIPFSEGWELAYRLHKEGAGIYPVRAASYHLYHHHVFAEPEAAQEEVQVRCQAIEYMVHKHRDSRIRLLYFWFAHLWPDPFLPEEAVIGELEEFDRRYRTLSEEQWQEYQIILDHHPLWSFLPEMEVHHEAYAR